MDIKKELTQIRTMLGSTLASCDDLLRDYSVSSGQLDYILEQVERAAVRLRVVGEAIRPRFLEGRKPAPPMVQGLTAQIEVTEFGWLHISFNCLLPSCKYKVPSWLQNTLVSLLAGYAKSGRRIPRFDCAMLIIEEHCSIENRQVFDQDNKGWKAIPNALKGLVIRDDDQFSLGIALLSKRSDNVACHIWVLPAEDAGEYFAVRSGNYGYTF